MQNEMLQFNIQNSKIKKTNNVLKTYVQIIVSKGYNLSLNHIKTSILVLKRKVKKKKGDCN